MQALQISTIAPGAVQVRLCVDANEWPHVEVIIGSNLRFWANFKNQLFKTGDMSGNYTLTLKQVAVLDHATREFYKQFLVRKAKYDQRYSM